MTSTVLGLVLGGLAVSGGVAWWWRREFLRDQPLDVWSREWPSGEAAARAAAEVLGLSVSRLPDDRAWLTDMLFSPVWLFWGDLRTRRPERHLRRWRLSGTREGREVSIRFGREDLRVAVGTKARFQLWAAAPRGGRALTEQEGLRALFPVGGERWNEGLRRLEQAFSLGVQRVHLEDGELVATLALGVAMPPPERWSAIFDVLAPLASLLEAATG